MWTVKEKCTKVAGDLENWSAQIFLHYETLSSDRSLDITVQIRTEAWIGQFRIGQRSLDRTVIRMVKFRLWLENRSLNWTVQNRIWSLERTVQIRKGAWMNRTVRI